MKKKYYEYKGKMYSMQELADLAGIPKDAMRWRVRHWPSAYWIDGKPEGDKNFKPPAGWGGITDKVDKMIERALERYDIRQWRGLADLSD